MWYKNMYVNSYRPDYMRNFVKDITARDSLTIGIDYYALNVSSQYIPPEILKEYVNELINGKVLVLKAYKQGDNIGFSVLE